MFRPRRNRYAGRPARAGVLKLFTYRLAVRPSAMIACATAAVPAARPHRDAADPPTTPWICPTTRDIDPTSALNTTWPSSKRANTGSP